MKKRTWFAGGLMLVLAAAVAVAFKYGTPWSPLGAVAQAPAGGSRPVAVEVARAERKVVPLQVGALGTVTPVASVAIKARLETMITEVHFQDGAEVKTGDLLFTLDGRQIEAEIKRVQAVIAGAVAQLEQAERDVQRNTELAAKNAATVVTLNNARTQANMSRATAEANRATLENLRVQLDYTKIRAPISGRISAANVKVGNFVRPADTAPLATIIQMTPIYVTFTVPQRTLPEVRRAIAAESAAVEAKIPGEARLAKGHVAMIENAVDSGTGMVAIRAVMANEDELLWPGTLVGAVLTLRNEEAVTVPSAAVQVSQSGNFVFIVKDNAAAVRPVKVARTVAHEAVIESGLEGGEIVVTDGQLLLNDGTRVNPRETKAGS
jgi:RND family efflux transporter MFP subunit